MNLSETNQLLTYVSSLDNRKFDDVTVVAWQDILCNDELTDCREAVRRHFASETVYLMPAHVRRGAIVVRDERRQKHEVLALPSRFEDDSERVQRVKAGIAECTQALGVAAAKRATTVPDEGEVLQPTDIIRNRALERARREGKAGQ